MIKSQRVQNKLLIILSLLLLTAVVRAQSFKTITTLGTISSTRTTADKPQSKVWFHGGYWWTVAPVSDGTYIFRLDGTSWTQLVKISISASTKADVKSQADTVNILLVSPSTPISQTAKFLRYKFDSGGPTYDTLTSSNVVLDSFSETSTIDIDSNKRFWLASDGGGSSSSSGLKNINVRWSDYPYSTWSDSITLATGVSFDDICAITAYDPDGPSKIGVMWSDQPNTRFRFAYHIDGDSSNTWYYETIDSVNSPGTGIADDHINLKVASDGTIYAAVKTGYDATDFPEIGLLVKDHAGSWSSLYTVTEGDDNNPGTRPQVILNETKGLIAVLYTASRGSDDDILYKESSISSINFSHPERFLVYGSLNLNNISTTKQTFSDSVVIIFATSSNIWHGVTAKLSADSTTNGAGFAFNLDGSNDQLKRGALSSSLNITTAITLEAWISPNIQKDQSLISKTAASSGYDLALTSGGNVTFKINSTTLTSSSSYTAGSSEWTHIAATYSSATGMRIYINGILDNSNSTSGNIGTNSSSFYLGSESSTNFFEGQLDEIRIWNVVKTADQIRTNMCKKLTGSESGLIAYWNFDAPEGLHINDKTSNNNYVDAHDIPIYAYSWSGAAIGDASAYDYDVTEGFTQNLTHADGDDITATTTSGTVTGLQVYRVDSTPLRSGASNTADTLTTIDPLRYWGVKVFGSSTPTYTLIYNYNGHPGITSESGLGLLLRDNLSDDTWGELYASLNTTANTLTKTGLTGTEFALASSNAPLPVELSLFSGRIIGGNIILNWETATEVRNYGFDVEKSIDGKNFSKLGFVQGNGNSNSTKYYSFEDNSPETGINYYRLKQIDTDGSFEYSKIISVNLNIPIEFSLSQNYPNPFNPTTTIDFTLPSDTFVSLKVYDLFGKQTAFLINEQKEAGSYSLQFDGTNLASGNYIYVINAGGKVITKKMTLLK
ncbi:MAG: T9SS type A sorting domain-containing protein [Ignavibacteriales bacterium]|nr:T9SS type A sorting domain-containing protein [Ignavibacteriales bacterium]